MYSDFIQSDNSLLKVDDRFLLRYILNVMFSSEIQGLMDMKKVMDVFVLNP